MSNGTSAGNGDQASHRERLDRYFELVSVRPDAFINPHPEGIEIILEPAAVARAEHLIAAHYRDRGIKESWSQAGLYYEDPWIWLVRDVTKFPDGSFHPYHRVILKGGERGVVTVPILGGNLVLIEHYRNGIRDWSLEFPRGGPDAGQSTEALAEAELDEEIGARVTELRYVGNYVANSGIMTASMNVYLAQLESVGTPNRTEGIRSIITVSRVELEDRIRDGTIKDANTITAFQLARLNAMI